MDKLELDLVCPGCNKKLKQRVEDMHRRRSRQCPRCGAVITFDGDDGRKAQRAWDGLLKQLGDVKIKL